MFNHNKKVHFNTPWTKEHSNNWTSPDQSQPKKAIVCLSVKKAMATVFCDVEGIICIDNLEKDTTEVKTITEE